MNDAKAKLNKLIDDLKKAKENTQYLLDHDGALADMHGLGYWANEVERLRKEIKENIPL